MSLEIPTPETKVETQPLTIDRALTIIEGLRAEIYARGGNDSEFDMVDSIVSQMNEGLITSNESVEQVSRIVRDKQDYH